jgi:hypothetical protein
VHAKRNEHSASPTPQTRRGSAVCFSHGHEWFRVHCRLTLWHPVAHHPRRPHEQPMSPVKSKSSQVRPFYQKNFSSVSPTSHRVEKATTQRWRFLQWLLPWLLRRLRLRWRARHLLDSTRALAALLPLCALVFRQHHALFKCIVCSCAMLVHDGRATRSRPPKMHAACMSSCACQVACTWRANDRM